MTEYLQPSGMIAIGLIFLAFAGNYLVAGAVELAMRFKVSPLFIGITVVAAGTSLPELLVSVIAQLDGRSELNVGNIIGSNIFNIGLVLGPVLIWTRKKPTSPGVIETSGLLIGSLLLTAMLFLDQDAEGMTKISKGTGLVLGGSFLVMIFLTLQSGRKNPATMEVEKLSTGASSIKVFLSLLFGMGGLWLGAKFLVSGAVSLAILLGVSDTTIGLTIVSIGTGMPEFFASIAAIRLGSPSLAIGNVVGSNLFNTLAIVGAASFIGELKVNVNLLQEDLILTLLLTVGICTLLSPKRSDQYRKNLGIVFLLSYVGWLIHLMISLH